MPSTRIPLLYGAGSFGKPHANAARIHSLSEAQDVVDVFIKHGHREFDTSNLYGHGSSEELLGELDLKGGFVDTKVYPMSPGDHAPEKLRALVHESVKRLGSHNKINVLYLHIPDRTVPYEDTLREINELHKQGLFKEFGLSNFKAWEVAEIYTTAKLNGWIVPTVYQGVYNALEREMETDIIHCLRKYGIRFYGYSPLGGGLLAGTVLTEEDMYKTDGSRWDDAAVGDAAISNWLRTTYRPMLPTIRELHTVLGTHGMRFSEAALRWVQHHGVLTPTDGIIIAGKNAAQVEENLRDAESGPLPADVLELMEQAYIKYKAGIVLKA